MVPRLQRLYRRLEDIDLFIGGISEKAVPGSLLGPTFQCLVGDQFRRIRLGDRFWYEEPNQAGSFTEGKDTLCLYSDAKRKIFAAQVNAIKEVSLARILCDNSDNVQIIQPLAFKRPSNM